MPSIAHHPQPSFSDLRPGGQAFQRYRLERLLGAGGMGVVWLAQDLKLDRTIALKFLPDVLRLDPASRDELKRETRRSLDLTHPNLVRIHDFVEDDHWAAIAMEYVDGATLSELRVKREAHCFEAEDLGQWVRDLCQALDYAHHTACCVHRDLKPSNLMLTARGHLKITDFGIACSLQNTAARVSAWKSTGGTLGYMSPQQLRGELASPSDDIYSVGATLYELLTGRPPFYSGDISFQVREMPPKSICAQRKAFGLEAGEIPQVWEEVIASCLAKTPEERPRTAGEIARRLGLTGASCAPNLALAAEMPTIRISPQTASPRLPVRTWIVSGTVLVLTGLCAWSFLRPQPPVKPPAPHLAETPKPPARAQSEPSPVPAAEPAPMATEELTEPTTVPQVLPEPAETNPVASSVPVESATPSIAAAVAGHIVVESQPSGAEIFCDDVSCGHTPLILDREAGAYILRAKLSGRSATPQAVVINSGETEKVRFAFERQAATPVRRTTRKAAPSEDSPLIKIGRSIKNLFSGDKTKKK